MSSAISENLYANLGKSGLKVSKVIVGCMSFGLKSWADWIIEDEEEVFRILKKCYDSGIRTFDTADVYSNGHSEVLLGKFIKKYNIKRDRIVILSKLFFPVGSFPPGSAKANTISPYEFVNSKGLSRKHILDAVANSVKRLDTYIDVLQIHRFDPTTPIEETMSALHDTVKSGQVRYIGASTMKTYQFVMMQSIAEQNHWTKFISMQNCYNLLYREEEREMNQYCKETGVSIIPWSPNARGLLTRPISKNIGDTSRASNDKRLNPENIPDSDKAIIARVEEVAKSKNVSMASVATAWVLHKGGYPIVGFSKPERVDDALVALSLSLTDDEIKYLEEPYIPQYPI
ncbi:aryl-alcohol dehydrogenase (NAD+) activity protein [[Candida] boidinii]|nr:aryl-alcohol dehydrogenase (NAD+) activity protein [[Candida] boidinii]